MSMRIAVVGVLAVATLSGCSEAGSNMSADSASDESPRDLTCPTDLRSVSSPPFFDESAAGAPSPEGAVEAWLGSGMGRGLGPDYALDESRSHAWILRDDGTAEAHVSVKLTAGGGYFYYGHEACG